MPEVLLELKTDAEAEAFVETADLADYDLSGLVPVRFELRGEDKTVSLRLPEALLERVRLRAEQVGMPLQRFIQTIVENALHEQAGCYGD